MPELIYETILTTLDAQGNPYIAPFGIREREGLVLISPFRPSNSLDNLLREKSAVINLTDDVRVFAGAFAGKREWPCNAAEKVQGVVLANALAHRELELVNVEEDATRPSLYFRVVHESSHAPFRGFNRAQAAVIELSVLVSRLHMLPFEKIEAELAYLSIAINKTAGSRELEAWGWLTELIENHRAAISGGNLA